MSNRARALSKQKSYHYMVAWHISLPVQGFSSNMRRFILDQIALLKEQFFISIGMIIFTPQSVCVHVFLKGDESLLPDEIEKKRLSVEGKLSAGMKKDTYARFCNDLSKFMHRLGTMIGIEGNRQVKGKGAYLARRYDSTLVSLQARVIEDELIHQINKSIAPFENQRQAIRMFIPQDGIYKKHTVHSLVTTLTKMGIPLIDSSDLIINGIKVPATIKRAYPERRLKIMQKPSRRALGTKLFLEKERTRLGKVYSSEVRMEIRQSSPDRKLFELWVT